MFKMGNTMKKVVIVAHGLSDGGAERVASILANFFAKNNVKVTYICAYRNVNNTNREEYVLDDRIDIKYIEISAKVHVLRFIMRNVKIRNVIADIAPDVVISFINFDTLFTALSGIPIIYTLRNDPFHVRSSKFRSFIFDVEYRKAKNIVFQTKGAMDTFGNVIKNKSLIIPNPLVTDDLPVWNVQSNKKRFITACRLNRQKNIKMLVDAFVQVHVNHPDYVLEIYGDGELRNSIEEQIRENNAELFIKLMGYTTQIHEIMADSTGFVMSSDYEGLSNAMLEALCVGIPCICTDCPPGGAREYIENGVNGFLTEVGNAKDMATKIGRVIENEELRRTFSSISMKYRDTLSVDRICEKWLDIINEEVI